MLFRSDRLYVGPGTGGVFLYPNGYMQGRDLFISSQFGSGGSATIGNNLSVGNKLTVIGNAVFSSNLSVTGAANISNIFTGNANMSGYANIAGNVTAGNIDGGNLITANFVAGDGYLLTNLTIAAGTALVNGNSNIVVEPNANITVSSNGVQNVIVLTDTTAYINTELVANANITVPTSNINLTGGNISVSGGAINTDVLVPSSGSSNGIRFSGNPGGGTDHFANIVHESLIYPIEATRLLISMSNASDQIGRAHV